MTTRYSSVIAPVRDRPGNDPIFIWNGEAQKRSAAGDDILNATMGSLMTDDGKLCVMPTVLETMKRLQTAQTAGYAPISGLPRYRAAVVRDLFGDGPLAGQAVAVASPGGSGAIYLAVVNFLEAGQKMLVPSYFWGPYREITAHSGRSLDPFPMFDSAGNFALDAMAEGLDRHLSTQGRALLVLNFPCHNPTGYTLSPEEWQKVIDIVNTAGARGPVTVVIDAAYMEFGGPLARTWIDAVPGLLQNATVLVAWTASKSMCQYGARVGALVALHRDAEEVRQMDNALGYACRSTWSNSHHLGQAAVTELLTDPELAGRIAAERMGLMQLLQERVDAFNRQARDAALPTPRYDAGFFVTVFTPDQDVTAAAMREHGVYVVPIPGAVRIAICSTPVASVPRVVAAVQAGLAAAN